MTKPTIGHVSPLSGEHDVAKMTDALIAIVKILDGLGDDEIAKGRVLAAVAILAQCQFGLRKALGLMPGGGER